MTCTDERAWQWRSTHGSEMCHHVRWDLWPAGGRGFTAKRFLTVAFLFVCFVFCVSYRRAARFAAV